MDAPILMEGHIPSNIGVRFRIADGTPALTGIPTAPTASNNGVRFRIADGTGRLSLMLGGNITIIPKPGI